MVKVVAAPQQSAARTHEPRRVGRFAPRRKHSRVLSEGEVFFYGRLEQAKGRLDEMRTVLEALGQRLDNAKPNETIEVEQDADAIEELIWHYNDNVESAQDAWLRHNLSRAALDRRHELKTPGHLRLPPFLDAEQQQRILSQGLEISRRLEGHNTNAERLILGMKTVEWIGTGAAIAAGGGILYAAAKKGGRWAVVKTVAIAGAAIAAEQGLESGLRATGASDEVIRGTRLAAAVVSFIILRRRIAAGRAARPNEQPSVPKAKGPAPIQPKETSPQAPSSPELEPVPKAPERSARPTTLGGTKTGPRPGSISGNPANKLVDTGIPRKSGIGWTQKWIRISDADYAAHWRARAKRLEELYKETRFMTPEAARRRHFEGISEWLRQ